MDTHAVLPLNALVLVNSASPAYWEGRQRVGMYLEHLDVPCHLVDLQDRSRSLPEDIQRYPLVILAHPQLDPAGKGPGQAGWSRLIEAVRAGVGLVSFDPSLSARIGDDALPPGSPATSVHALSITSVPHYITALHGGGEAFSLDCPVEVSALPGQALVSGDAGQPFLTVSRLDQGRAVHWASTAWMDTHVLGPLMGLDDLFWRAIVWAARKPFCLRGLPPIVTMRVDDVVGTGRMWDRSALYWVEDAIRCGFRPWLGLFIYNLEEHTVSQLRGLLRSGRASAFPHAFGRPPRGTTSAPQNYLPASSGASPYNFYYYADALPLRADSYDEFIYFDHQRGVPWSDAEAARGLQAVDRWYAAHAPLPISKAALPHWYEMGTNTCAHVRQQWGCEFIGKVVDIDLPLTQGDPWLKLGPFRRYEEPGECFPHTPAGRGRKPVYYADFLTLGGQEFFNSVTEIRTDFGYEWAPNADVVASGQRGVRQLRRALDSMALASLFTHETDYIFQISPERWAQIIEGVARGIAAYQPIQMTLDDGTRYLRATKTSHLASAHYQPETGLVTAVLKGQADVPTHFYLFTGEGDSVDARLVEVPPFSGEAVTQAEI